MENEIKHITMSFTGRYGHYYLDGVVNGKKIRVVTTDSETFDWYNDDSNEEKHLRALEHCHRLLIDAYDINFNN